MSIPVHFRGVVLGPSGFAAQGREWLALLEQAGFEPSLEGALLGDVEGGETEGERLLIRRCAARPFRPGSVTVHHMLVPHFRPDPRAVADVLITVFETESLPAGWAEGLQRTNAVVVPAEFNRRSFARAGVAEDRLHVIPVPVDSSRFRPGADPAPCLPPRPPGVFRLLSVLDWSLRKGWDLLVPAFARAFGAGEAELVLKVAPRPGQRQRVEQDLRRMLAGRSGLPAIHVCDAALSSDELPGLYGAVDVLVLPSRGEGWGRPVHEAMLMELPVVATRAGALATLLPDERFGYPVAGRTARVGAAAAAETSAFAGQEWHEPDAEDLVRRLREVAADPQEAARRGRAARQHILELCDPASIATRFGRLLEALSPASAARR